jgi:pimeloyl-ACP methyl ester carboxylesterase
VELQADLYLADKIKPGERRPALVAGHGFSAVREALQPQGEYFSAAGYIVLALDYRSFGRSGGTVRGELFPDRQVEDFSAGISFLQTRDDVEGDRIGVWGTSFGGGVALAVGARDRRARVVISQVPITDPRRWMRWLRSPEQWEQLLDAIDEDRTRRFRGAHSARIPVVGPFAGANVCAMPTSSDVLDFVGMNPPNWRNDLSMESMEKILQFNPLASIREISPRPLCVIMNTGYEVLHSVDQVMDAYSAAAEPKKLVLLPYDQLGFYADQGQNDAMAAALAFLQDEMPVGSKKGGVVPRSRFTQ